MPNRYCLPKIYKGVHSIEEAVSANFNQMSRPFIWDLSGSSQVPFGQCCFHPKYL